MSHSDQATSMSVDHPFWKALTALLAGFGVSSWSDFAAFVAAAYTLLLMAEWLWKRVGRPFCERRGWISRPKRRATDRS